MRAVEDVRTHSDGERCSYRLPCLPWQRSPSPMDTLMNMHEDKGVCVCVCVFVCVKKREREKEREKEG